MTWQDENTKPEAWATGPTPGDDEWNQGPVPGAEVDWKPPVTPEGDDFSLPPVNISKHEDSFHGGACHNCGQPGHMSRECPEEKKFSGTCYNCGETGHNKVDCTNAKLFIGTCRVCGQEGHPAAECPTRPAEVCKNCTQEGHKAIDCKNNRVLDVSNVKVMDAESAWEELKTAVEDRDMEDIRDAIASYCKAVPGTTLLQLEQAFRDQKLRLYLIAVEPELPKAFTLVDLQGKIDRQYKASYHFQPTPRAKNEKEGWPANAAENLTRLKNAGFLHDRLVEYCSKCDELGHIRKHCPIEETIDRVEVKCANCQEQGHRVRDCPQARDDPYACRNCKSVATITRWFPIWVILPKTARRVENLVAVAIAGMKEGHMAKECAEPRNMATVACRNCDQVGHFSRECPLPTDWSKVKCNNCGEMGHTVKRCKQPVPDTTEGYGGAEPLASAGVAVESGPVAASGAWEAGAAGGSGW
ncbi:MAG: hypothetical protein M1838_005804 [Thelocarpon superellum]|nr:MAG: hypothetical protein M1838_005804 [Thelocarpon superellum]